MPYIGRGPSKSGAFRILKDFSASFDGSATSFAIQDTNGTALSVATPQNLMIAVDGVLQEPGSAYTISGTNIVFGSAPQDSATFWGVELGDIGGTSVSSSDQILVVATGHSFVVGRWMKATSTDGVYAYADCTTEANAEVAGVIISTTTDTYTLQVHGTVTGDAVPAQASGTIMFLDASNGQMTTTETSTAGRVSKPLAIVTKNDSEMVILTYRGEVISSNVQTNAPNDATYLTTTANGTLTAEVVVGTSPGGELGGTWSSPTVDGTHSGSAHHAEAHTVASHSDTTATGAELETLTDGSTTALHVHAIADDSIVEAKLDVSNAPTNGQFLQAQSGEGGGLTWAAAGASDKSAKRMLSAPQEIASGWSDYVVTWGTNVFDTGSYASESNTSFKASTANGTTGKHIVTVSIRWEANSTSDRTVYIQHMDSEGNTGDGVLAKSTVPSCDNSNTETEQTITALTDLADGEFVRVRVSQQSGAGLDVSHSNSQFSIIKIA